MSGRTAWMGGRTESASEGQALDGCRRGRRNELPGPRLLTFGGRRILLLFALLNSLASGLIHPLSAERRPKGLFPGGG